MATSKTPREDVIRSITDYLALIDPKNKAAIAHKDITGAKTIPATPQQIKTEPDIENKAISIAQKIFFDAIVSVVISELLDKGYIKE